MDREQHTQQPKASGRADVTPESLLARLYKADAILAHFLEILLKLQETQPELAYCLEYLLFASEGQRKTAQAGFRLIESAKKRGEKATSGQSDTQGS